MTRRLLIISVAVTALSGTACTVNQVDVPPLTGPSTFATAVTLSANPDSVAMGQSATAPGQQSLIIVSVFDASGQPKPFQRLRLDTLVNGSPSSCGKLSQTTLITGSDGKASAVFTAPGFPPNCPSPIFNSDGSITVRATPVGTDSQGSAFSASSVSIFMALPAFVNPVTGFVVDFSVSPSTGVRNFTFNGSASSSPGHAITTYAWKFSDGTAKTGGSPVVEHDFGSPGTYVVTLTITDDIGQEGSKPVLLQVS